MILLTDASLPSFNGLELYFTYVFLDFLTTCSEERKACTLSIVLVWVCYLLYFDLLYILWNLQDISLSFQIKERTVKFYIEV